MGLNLKICKCLYQAQLASDHAKGIYYLSNYFNRTIDNYKGKDEYIITAIKTCIKKRNTGFKFYVKIDGEVATYLVYFKFRDEKGNPHQISFHSFNGRLCKYTSPLTWRQTWDELSSRQTARFLLDYWIKERGKE